MVSLARLLIVWLVFSLTAGMTSAQQVIEPDPIGDTTLLPYGVTHFIESSHNENQMSVNRPARLLTTRRTAADSIAYIFVSNCAINQDDAASVFVNRLPDNRTLSQDPVFLTISDYCLFRDSANRRDGVALIGFRNDSAFIARNFPGSNEFDMLFLTTGVDHTGNGKWIPSPYHIASFDYDYDGTAELFFYLMVGRDKRPRICYCIDIERLVVEWSLPMAASATPGNTVSCFDSTDPGILVCAYGPENGVTDPNFDDQYGYLTRLNQRGEIVFNYRLAPKFANVSIRTLPGDTLYALSHQFAFPGQSDDSSIQWLSIIGADGTLRQSITIQERIAFLELVDLMGDERPEILLIGIGGDASIFDLSLKPLAYIVGANLGQYLAQFRLPKSGETVLQIVVEGGSVLYSKDWECRGYLPGIASELLPAAFDSAGGVTMFVTNAGNGFLVGYLQAKQWSQRLVALLWRYRTWFVIALFLVSIQLVVVNIRRRRAINALKKAEARNDAMLNATPDLMFRMTADGIFLDYQASRQSELFFPGTQFLGKPAREVLPQPLAELVHAAIAQVLSTGKMQYLEYQLPMGNGFEDFEARIVASGPSEVLAIVRNISDRKRSEQALRDSESNFRAFFETIGDMLIVADRTGRILLTNRTLRTKLGYSSEELTTMKLVDLHPADRRDEALSLIDAILRGKRNDCPLPLLKKNGSLVSVETRLWFGRWDGSECLFGLSKDLSAEQEAKMLFEQLFQFNPALMALTDITHGRFVDVNDSFLQTIGYDREEVIGHTPGELSIFVDPEQQAAAGKRLRQTGRIADIELRVRRKDGAILHGLFSGEVIRSQETEFFLTVMIDITEKKNATEELRASREFLGVVLDSIPARVFWKDKQGLYLGCNSQFARDAGFHTPEEIIGKDDYGLVWREQAELYRADDRAVIESGEPKLLIEEPQTTPTGELIHLLTSKVPLRDPDGTVVGVLGTYQDITERMRAEEALRESEEKFRGLTEHSNMGILQYDDVQVLYANEQLARMLEIDVHELISMPLPAFLKALVGEDNAVAWMDRIRRRLAGGDAPNHFEAEITTFRGTPKRLEALARRIQAPDRVLIQATWLDITDRHQIELSLRESEAKFRAVAESVTAGITIFGADRLLYCNPASTRITGYTLDELLKMSFWEVIHPDFRQMVTQRGRERLAGNDVPPRYEVKIVRKDGEDRWVDYSAKVIQFMGQTCVLGTTIDITDRVHAEAELQRIYQERYQQVREIAGGVSHEIYNSLFPATTCLYKMRERLEGRSGAAEETERDLKLLGLAEQAIARAIHMTESVTHYSRLEANRKIEEVSVGQVVAEIIEQNRARCDRHGVRVDSNISPDAVVACSGPHFNSLLNNLVVNAIDALHETEQPLISITARSTREQVSIRIADNGPGIPAENLPRIFNAFFSTKPRSGTGIGLAMAKKIAEMYGGSIKVTSGHGTCFDIVLPRYEAEAGGTRATE